MLWIGQSDSILLTTARRAPGEEGHAPCQRDQSWLLREFFTLIPRRTASVTSRGYMGEPPAFRGNQT